MTKPPMTYYGGKIRIAERVAALLPEHDQYLEPFAGSLAVLLAKRPAPHETVNDLDGELMAFWRVLRDRPTDLARVCALTPHSRAEHEASRDLAGLDDLELARRVWVQVTQSRAGVRRKTGWRQYIDPAGTKTSMPAHLDAYVDRMAAAAERLHNVSLECRPALELIRAFGRIRTALIYADPPYLHTVRSGGEKKREYLHDMYGERQHLELLDELRADRAAVVLSGYSSPLYDDLLAGWDRVEIPTVSGHGTDRRRTEVLWSNRPISNPHLFSGAAG